jgi:hypothetical protein
MNKTNLPFPRGGTASDFGVAGLTLSDTWLSSLEGQEFEVQDTIHGTGTTVRLRIVKNDTGSPITAANQLLRFSTGEKDFGRRIAGVSNSQTTVCVPLDDAYTAGLVIPDDDLFYVVMRGPVKIAADAADMAINAHDNVCSDGSTGTLYKLAATEPQFIVGVADQGSDVEDTPMLIWADINLKASPPAAVG